MEALVALIEALSSSVIPVVSSAFYLSLAFESLNNNINTIITLATHLGLHLPVLFIGPFQLFFYSTLLHCDIFLDKAL